MASSGGCLNPTRIRFRGTSSCRAAGVGLAWEGLGPTARAASVPGLCPCPSLRSNPVLHPRVKPAWTQIRVEPRACLTRWAACMTPPCSPHGPLNYGRPSDSALLPDSPDTLSLVLQAFAPAEPLPRSRSLYTPHSPSPLTRWPGSRPFVHFLRCWCHTLSQVCLHATGTLSHSCTPSLLGASGHTSEHVLEERPVAASGAPWRSETRDHTCPHVGRCLAWGWASMMTTVALNFLRYM